MVLKFEDWEAMENINDWWGKSKVEKMKIILRIKRGELSETGSDLPIRKSDKTLNDKHACKV